MDLAWIDRFLPLLRCPDTQQPLRWATPAELTAAGKTAEEKSLVTEDGSRFYPIDAGIPVLLPQA